MSRDGTNVSLGYAQRKCMAVDVGTKIVHESKATYFVSLGYA